MREHTLVKWNVDHFGFNDYFGLFGQITGTMTMDPRQYRGRDVRDHGTCGPKSP